MKTQKRRGRPPLKNGDALTERFECRLTPEQKAKVDRLGGALWLRARIDRAATPKGTQ